MKASERELAEQKMQNWDRWARATGHSSRVAGIWKWYVPEKLNSDEKEKQRERIAADPIDELEGESMDIAIRAIASRDHYGFLVDCYFHKTHPMALMRRYRLAMDRLDDFKVRALEMAMEQFQDVTRKRRGMTSPVFRAFATPKLF